MIDKLNRIIALRREINALCNQIDAETGVKVIGDNEEIQLYRGIEKVAEEISKQAEDTVWYRSPRRNIAAEGYTILQLSVSDDSNVYREARKHEAL